MSKKNNTSFAKTCIITGFLFISTLSYSQDKDKADSIRTILTESEISDSTRLYLLYRLSFQEPDPEKKLEVANNLISLATTNDNRHALYQGYFYQGYAYKKIGSRVEAIKSYLKCVELSDNDKRKANALSCLADVYASDNFSTSIKYYKDALQLLEKLPNKEDFANSTMNLGDTYLNAEILDTAIFFFEKAMIIYDSLHNEIGYAYGLGNLGAAKAKQGYPVEAESLINRAIVFLEKNHDYYPISVYLTYMSGIYEQKQNYSRALAYAKKSLKLAHNYNLKEQIGDANKLIAELYRKDKKFELAYTYLEQHYIYEDKINNKAVIRKMADLRTEYEVSTKQTELDLLSEQNRVNKILLYSGAAGLILVILIAIVIYRASIVTKRLSIINKKQADKLVQLDAAKSRFFANVSHDLRSPLTLILGGLGQVIANKEVFLTTKAERQLKVAQLNSERIIHMTNEINELIQLEDGELPLHKKYVNIDDLLDLFVKMFSVVAEQKEISFSYSKTQFKEDPIVHIDPQQFEKVLFNLITNALKHTQSGDTIKVSLTKEKSELVIAVTDSGEGISADKLPFIFERYFQAADESYKAKEGFGIGLAFVQEILLQHDAKIEVKSELHKGSSFIINIPIQFNSKEALYKVSELIYSEEKSSLYREIDEKIVEDAPIINVNPMTKDEHGEIQKTILIVEDHPEVREFIVDIVSSKYNVLTAQNGHKALKVLDKEKVDLVITDLMMPHLDGFELLECLKEDENLRKIPALVLSARNSEEDKIKVLAQGVNDFLNKPFDPSELLLRIENLLIMRDAWNSNDLSSLINNGQETLDEIERSLLKKVEQLILERITEPELSISYLAEEIAVSERKFYRMIKKMTNNTPFTMIKEIRLQLAHKMLTEKNVLNSSEVAKSVGMTNVTHFNTQFKKRFGKSPSDMI